LPITLYDFHHVHIAGRPSNAAAGGGCSFPWVVMDFFIFVLKKCNYHSFKKAEPRPFWKKGEHA
jgi:hypothetical protein